MLAFMMKPMMKKSLFFMLAFIFFISIDAVFASECNVEFRIINDKVHVSYSMEFENKSNFSIILPEDAKAIDVYADNNRIEAAKKIAAEAKSLRISYVASFVEKAQGKSFFLADVKLPCDPSVILVLPEYSVLEKAFPQPETSSNGRSILLKWKQKKGFSAFVVYKEKISFTTKFIIIALMALIAFVAITTVLVLFRLKKKTSIAHLLPQEQVIINILKKEKEAWQKQLQLKTGFSKAKLSRVLRDLEARGMIKKIPYGNTNKIKLA